MILGPCLSHVSLNYLHWSPEVAAFRDTQWLEVLALETNMTLPSFSTMHQIGHVQRHSVA